MRPVAEENELHITDQRYNRIAPLAIQRSWHLLEDKTRFLHTARETGRANRKQARDKKSQLFLDIGNQPQEQGRRWEASREV